MTTVSASGSCSTELEPDRPLACNHVQVLVRMDEGRAGFLDVCARRRERVLEGLTRELDPGAVVPRRLDLRHRRLCRHEDRRGDFRFPCRPRHGLAVVPRARGDDPGLALLLGERLDLVDGAADLEGTGPLEVLGLQVARAGRRAA